MKLLVLDVAALGWNLWQNHRRAAFWDQLTPHAAETVFPALTCPVQAMLRTALPPEKHGLFLNGRYDRILKKAQFWEQSSALYGGERLWNTFRAKGKRVGQLCLQQSLGNDSDILLSPQPIHKHHGGMIQNCYTAPTGMYAELVNRIHKPFNLFHYWGPLASWKSTRWIADAAIAMLREGEWAPDLFYVYFPHLDYEQQKSGPNGAKVGKAFQFVEGEVERLFNAARTSGYEVVILGDYAITDATQVIYPNRILREAGYFKPRIIQEMVYDDPWRSDAFAVVDHQAAQIAIGDNADRNAIRILLEKIPGVKRVFHPGGSFPVSDWMLEADAGAWFAYPWWFADEKGPNYATHMDIHNKPGFDPCELFTDWWPPMAITQDTSRVGGTHGAAGPDYPVFFGSTVPDFAGSPSLLDFTARLKVFCDS